MRPRLAIVVSFAACLLACGEAAADVPGGPTPETPEAPGAPREPRAEEVPSQRDGTAPSVTTRDTEEAGGRWVDLGQLSDRRHRARDVRAWVPAHEEGARLPMLVVLDGQGTSEWFRIPETLSALVAEGAIEPWIVLAIDSTVDRTRELGRTDERFARFLHETVLPAARAGLPTREGRESTAILGYSYGGLAAVAATIARPDDFGRVIAMSPSLWVAQRDVIARFQHARTLPRRLWIDVGSREPDAEDLIPYMVGDARDLRDVALDRGLVFGRDVGFDEALGEGHDMSAAGRRMRAALLFALGDRDLSGETPTALSITRYPSHGRRATHAIQTQYERGARLTWPERLVEAHAGDTTLRRDVAGIDRPLTVRAFGLEATCP
ncbi:MAG: alpha/beta hydrolase-fold protein [Sandaracinus sp.]